MIAKKMVKFVEGSSVTRAMFEEGKKMAVEFGLMRYRAGTKNIHFRWK